MQISICTRMGRGIGSLAECGNQLPCPLGFHLGEREGGRMRVYLFISFAGVERRQFKRYNNFQSIAAATGLKRISRLLLLPHSQLIVSHHQPLPGTILWWTFEIESPSLCGNAPNQLFHRQICIEIRVNAWPMSSDLLLHLLLCWLCNASSAKLPSSFSVRL